MLFRSLAILDALRSVVDPEIGMNVVELALIKQIILGPESTEVKMILTTPFCPYAGSMIQQVKEQAESVVEHEVTVTLLDKEEFKAKVVGTDPKTDIALIKIETKKKLPFGKPDVNDSFTTRPSRLAGKS